MELFLNRVWATLASGIDGIVTTLPLTTGHGARFGTIAAGNKVRIVFLDASKNVSEVCYITGITGDNATIARAQDGTTAVAHLAGDRIEARIGKSTMDNLMQPVKIQNGAETLLGNVLGTDIITATANPTLLVQAATGSLWKMPSVGANTTSAVTLNIDGMGAVNAVRPDGTALQPGDTGVAGYPCLWEKRAADFVLINPANLTAQDYSSLAALIAAGTAKATPVDADKFLISDSAAGNAPKTLTWANLKATFYAALGGLIAAGTAKATPVDADSMVLADSAAGNAPKTYTWANLKATLLAYFTTGGVMAGTATPLVESGAGAVGASALYARQDHVHPAISRAWTNVSASRASGVTYTNTTTNDIYVMINNWVGNSAPGYSVTPYVNGVALPEHHNVYTGSVAGYGCAPVFFVVPPGANYSVSIGSAWSLWFEFR